MIKFFLLMLLLPFLVQCSADPPAGGLRQASFAPPNAMPKFTSGPLQQIINVSSYDPKERHRSGRGYSQYDVSALRSNGARGLIARAGKGMKLDEKCAAFVASADRAGLLAGLYYRVQSHQGITAQADQFVNRAVALARSRPAGVAPLLLSGDYDGDLKVEQILRFQDRVEARTGIVPVSYLENSQALKLELRAASARNKARMARAPYWIALYSHESGAGPIFPAPGNPDGLVKQYAVWRNWTLWQYGGVTWENRRSNPKVYSHGRYRFPRYFGNMDRPLERNVFRGSLNELVSFWSSHGIRKR